MPSMTAVLAGPPAFPFMLGPKPKVLVRRKFITKRLGPVP